MIIYAMVFVYIYCSVLLYATVRCIGYVYFHGGLIQVF